MTTLESTWKLLKVFMLNFIFFFWVVYTLSTKVPANVLPNLPPTARTFSGGCRNVKEPQAEVTLNKKWEIFNSGG